MRSAPFSSKMVIPITAKNIVSFQISQPTTESTAPKDAIFQFVSQGGDAFYLQVKKTNLELYSVRFKIFYKYNDEFYKHPYMLCSNPNAVTKDQDEVSFNISQSGNNTIPAKMDFCLIRWIRKILAGTLHQHVHPQLLLPKDFLIKDTNQEEKVVNLGHSTGVLIANVEGTGLTFSPRSGERNGNVNDQSIVKTYVIPSVITKHSPPNGRWGTTNGQYIVDLAFDNRYDPDSAITASEVQKLFVNNDRILSVCAERDQSCHHLLEFPVPVVPEYHGKRVYLRMRHSSSKDYNPSEPALTDECFIYQCDMPVISTLNIQPTTITHHSQLLSSSPIIDEVITHTSCFQPSSTHHYSKRKTDRLPTRRKRKKGSRFESTIVDPEAKDLFHTQQEPHSNLTFNFQCNDVSTIHSAQATTASTDAIHTSFASCPPFSNDIYSPGTQPNHSQTSTVMINTHPSTPTSDAQNDLFAFTVDTMLNDPAFNLDDSQFKEDAFNSFSDSP
ncbi:unnamed protein product [Didymodactylos carnosus]|uniref:Uncharacterized protein n=1 Tax=Didymodactylos carnosus TaxID=1234261 RepID=A0A8S2DPU7_9BILA|nr:unnamed protein product [Didymodactylos carnosus]CAF3719903.1 unnamed protein product [Didymodactylos carnosus]